MNKIKYIGIGLISQIPILSKAADGDIDMSAVEGAATKIQTALTSFFTSTLIPLLVAVGGVALSAYLVMAIFRWARKVGK